MREPFTQVKTSYSSFEFSHHGWIQGMSSSMEGLEGPWSKKELTRFSVVSIYNNILCTIMPSTQDANRYSILCMRLTNLKGERRDGKR